MCSIQSSRDILLCELPANNTRNIQSGMCVSEEASWVGLDLRKLESCSSVNTVGEDTGSEGTGHAAN